MTDREKAIVMAYTGVCMLQGERLGEFYKYLEELYSRPVYTHELLTLNIKDKSKKDFLSLCRKAERSPTLESYIFEYEQKGYERGFRAGYTKAIADIENGYTRAIAKIEKRE